MKDKQGKGGGRETHKGGGRRNAQLLGQTNGHTHTHRGSYKVGAQLKMKISLENEGTLKTENDL